MHTKRALVVAVAFFGVMASGKPAAALDQSRPHHRVVAIVCQWNLDRYCSHTDSRRDQDLACLARRAERLGPLCYRALRVAASVDACRTDYERYCNHVPPGAGRGLVCLKGNADRLSARCSGAMAGPGRSAQWSHGAHDPGEEGDWQDADKLMK